MMKRIGPKLLRREALLLTLLVFSISSTAAAPLPGGTLDPLTIPKYVIPLVIPPEMPRSPATSLYNQGGRAQYNIAMRQFQQQILPGGIWQTLNPAIVNPLPATPVWSYGRADDPIPTGGVAPVPATQSSFNYPAFTVEATADLGTSVRWINELVAIDPVTGFPYPSGDPLRTFLPHVVSGSVDQSLHWANPGLLTCADGSTRTDCRPDPSSAVNPGLGAPYTGPVPIITHVHGAHVNPVSDGYPEAWWLPDAVDATGSPISGNYAMTGAQFDQANRNNAFPGSAFFRYRNDQAPTTIWYHDHTLGMTRNNVYAGPAGFWLIRGTYTSGTQTVPDTATDGVNGALAVLPGQAEVIPTTPGRPTDPTVAGGCDPNFDAVCRAGIREIPIAIQGRSFNADGSLFYPQTRDFFNFIRPNATIPYIPSDPATCGSTMTCSDIAPIWNPEFFGNTIVVNGTTWPDLQVTPQRYRLRLLNGTDARFLNLSLWVVPPKRGAVAPNAYTLNSKKLINRAKFVEMPIYQIGADQGFLPQVVEITTGFATPLPGNGTSVALGTQPAQMTTFAEQALLMSPAERADVILDFTNLAPGTVVRMVNTGPDAPFGGFPAAPLADKNTTGQVMSFTVVAAGQGITDPSTPVENLVLPADVQLAGPDNSRQVSLNEAESDQICVKVNAATGKIKKTVFTLPVPAAPGTIAAICAQLGAVPFAPKEALLGTLPGGVPAPQFWADPIAQSPVLGATEDWEIFNYTVDAHPIHIHLVRFQVMDRAALTMDPTTGMPFIPAIVDPATVRPPEATEAGYKDTVTAYPGEVTRVRALFDIPGLYVWHCHIIEHEDNEMMVPFCVGGTSGRNCRGSTVPVL